MKAVKGGRVSIRSHGHNVGGGTGNPEITRSIYLNHAQHRTTRETLSIVNMGTAQGGTGHPRVTHLVRRRTPTRGCGRQLYQINPNPPRTYCMVPTTWKTGMQGQRYGNPHITHRRCGRVPHKREERTPEDGVHQVIPAFGHAQVPMWTPNLFLCLGVIVFLCLERCRVRGCWVNIFNTVQYICRHVLSQGVRH